MNRGPQADRARLDRFDLLVGLGAFLAAAAYLIALHQHELWGDGQGLYDRLERGADPWWSLHYHAAYLPVVRFLAWAAPTALTYDGYLLASSLPTAAGLVFVLWSLRLLGVGRGGALAVAVACSLTPALVLFGTLLEVHALHFGGVAFAVWLSLVALRAPTRRGVLCVQALAFFAVSATHSTAPVLVPGWAAWCTALLWLERNEETRAIGARRTFVVSAIGATAALAVTALIIEFGWRANRSEGGLSFIVSVVDQALESVAPRRILAEWVLAYGWALAPLAFSLLLLRHGPTRRAIVANTKPLLAAWLVWMIVPMLALNVWSVANLGGYTAGLAPMFAIGLGAVLVQLESPPLRRAWIAVAALAALVQPIASGWQIAEREARFLEWRPEVHAEAVAALPEGGTLLTYSPLEYNLSVFEPEWRQVNVYFLLRVRADGTFQHEPRSWVLHELVRPGGPVVLDLRFRAAPIPARTPLAAQRDAFDAALEEFFEFEAVPPEVGLVAVLRPKPEAVARARSQR